MKGCTLTCKFCGETTRIHRFTQQDLAVLCAAYVAHLVESHWDMLEKGRQMRADAGLPVNDAWTRL
jgi:hypothetical protein